MEKRMTLLTLTRKEGEAVLIETPTGMIRVTWANDRGMAKQTRITIQAPHSFRIAREEKYFPIKKEDQNAST